MSEQHIVYPVNVVLDINKDIVNGTPFSSISNSKIFIELPKTSGSSDLANDRFQVDILDNPPAIRLNKGVNGDANPLSGIAITANDIDTIALNNENSSVNLYSTSASIVQREIVDPPVPYVAASSVVNHTYTVAGHYADYTDGVSDIRRIYQGFYRDGTPAIGAVTATSTGGLLSPSATITDISMRSPLSMGTNEIKSEGIITVGIGSNSIIENYRIALSDTANPTQLIELLNYAGLQQILLRTANMNRAVLQSGTDDNTVLPRVELVGASVFIIDCNGLKPQNDAGNTGQYMYSDGTYSLWKTPFVSGQELVQGLSSGTIVATGVSAITPIVATLFSNNAGDASNILTITSQTTGSFSWRTSATTQTGAVVNWIATLI